MIKDQPVANVQWVPIEEVCPNDYNPNTVAEVEMKLLYTSIKHDGYTQPIVTIKDEETGKFVIVDGFHRYFVAKTNPDILERNEGKLPIVVIDKDINDRMASTVRHNRARGEHSIKGMSSMVFSMLKRGWKDDRICNELGMEPEELLRLKHMTGFSALFKGAKHSEAWQTHNQVKVQHKAAQDPQ
jgi:ParB-like chromosome segregation protein Spo0J